jgi:hydrogenase maturation protease
LDHNTPLLVIGVGNPYRGDDAAGLVIAGELKERAPAGVDVRENAGELATMMELLENADAVIFIDAVCSGSEAGEVFRFDAAGEMMPAEYFRYSTHGFGIPEAVELARALGRLPGKVIVYGVEGKAFDMGAGLSPEVEASVGAVVERVLDDIGNIREESRQ